MKKIAIRVRVVQTIFFILVLLLISSLLVNMPRVVIPLGIAYVVGLILVSPLNYLIKIGFSRDLSILFILLVMGFFLIYPIVLLVPILKDEMQNLQFYIPKIETFLRSGYYEMVFKIKDKIGIDIGQQFFDDILSFGHLGTRNFLLKVPTIVASVLEYTFLIPVFVFFILKDATTFKKMFLKLIPNSIFERSYYLYHQFNKQLGDYIFAKFVEASIVSCIVLVGLLSLEVKFAWLLGIFAGLASIIPYVGPVIGVVPGLAVCAMEYGINPIFWLTLILYIFANVVDFAFIFPVLVSKIVNLHPMLVIISVILGSQYMGMVGMIISIPVVAIIKLVFAEVYKEIYPVLSKHDTYY